MPITIRDLVLQLGLRWDGSRPGREHREKLRAASASGRIKHYSPWRWDSNDPELQTVRNILQGSKPVHNWREHTPAVPAISPVKAVINLPPFQAPAPPLPPPPAPALPPPPPKPLALTAAPAAPATASSGSKRSRRASEKDDDNDEEEEEEEEDEEGEEKEEEEKEVVPPPRARQRTSAAASGKQRAPARNAAPKLDPSAPGTALVNKRIEIWWEEEDKWYAGTVKSYTMRRGHLVEYDPVPGEDDRSEYYNLDEEKWRLEGQRIAQVPAARPAPQAAPLALPAAVVGPSNGGVLASTHPTSLMPAPTQQRRQASQKASVPRLGAQQEGKSLLASLDAFEAKLKYNLDTEEMNKVSAGLTRVNNAIQRQLAKLYIQQDGPDLTMPD